MMGLQLNYIQYGLFYTQCTAGLQYQGQADLASTTAGAGMQDTGRMERLRAACCRKTQGQRVREHTAGRLPEEKRPL